MKISEQFTQEEKEAIIKADFKEFFCIWRNTKGELKEKRSDSPEALYFYENHYNAVIYQDHRCSARKRLQRILKSNK